MQRAALSLAMIDSVCPSVRPSQPGIMTKDSRYDHAVKFQREHKERGRRMRKGQENTQRNLVNKSLYLRKVQDRTMVTMRD